ncbi:MAG: hypothetical protein ACKOAD_07265 [Gammaproteobacteria bacterium]
MKKLIAAMVAALMAGSVFAACEGEGKAEWDKCAGDAKCEEAVTAKYPDCKKA